MPLEKSNVYRLNNRGGEPSVREDSFCVRFNSKDRLMTELAKKPDIISTRINPNCVLFLAVVVNVDS